MEALFKKGYSFTLPPNTSLLPNTTNTSLPFQPIFECLDSRTAMVLFSVISLINFLLMVPLNTWVMWLGTRPGVPMTTPTTTKTIEIFTCNLAAMEIGHSFIITCFSISYYLNVDALIIISIMSDSLVTCGRPLFHCCTCLERYLAVVHPVAYLRLRAPQYRWALTGVIWLVSLGWVGVMVWCFPFYPTKLLFGLFLPPLMFMCFCSLAVLRVLIRPGPGEGGGDKKQREQLKMRAFRTIMVILATLVVSFGSSLIVSVVKDVIPYDNGCIALVVTFLFFSPSSAVQPILFLHKVGKLHCL